MNGDKSDPTTPWGPETDFNAAFQHVVSEVFRFRGILLAAGEQAIRDQDISVGCWQAMAVIRHDPMTVAEVSRRLGLARQSVQLSMNRLLKQGLVKTLDNPNHRRASLFKLTASGIEVLQLLRQRQSELTERFTHNLGYSIEDMKILAEHLSKMREQAMDFEDDDVSAQNS